MKKLLILVLVLSLVMSMSLIGIGCKEETAVEVASQETAVETDD